MRLTGNERELLRGSVSNASAILKSLASSIDFASMRKEPDADVKLIDEVVDQCIRLRRDAMEILHRMEDRQME